MYLNFIIYSIGILFFLIYIYIEFFNIENFKNNNDENNEEFLPVIEDGKIVDIKIMKNLSNYDYKKILKFEIIRNEPENNSDVDAIIYPIINNKKIIGTLIENTGNNYTDNVKITLNKSDSEIDSESESESESNSEQISLYKRLLDEIESLKKVILGTNKIHNAIHNNNISKEDKENKESAKKYDELLSEQKEKNKKNKEDAKKKKKEIDEHLKKEEEATKLAKKYNLPPPPKKYSQDEIDEVNNTLSKTDKSENMTPKQKAVCYKLLQDVNDKQDKSEDLGQRSEDQPHLQHLAKKASEIYEKALNDYNNQCT